MDWAQGLNVGGVTGWRLPNTGPVNGSYLNYLGSYDGSTDSGWNIGAPGSAYPGSTGSEMAHLFYITLGNLAGYDLYGNVRPFGTFGMLNTGPFVNDGLPPYGLGEVSLAWSNQARLVGVGDAFYFNFQDGRQNTELLTNYTTGLKFAIAVHDGDVGASTVPVPAAVWLFGSGLLGLIGVARRKTVCK